MAAPVAWPGAETALDRPQEYAEWDVLWLAGMFVPGLVEIGGTIGRKVEKRQEQGTDGAKQTILNYELAEFDVRVRLWTDKHFDQWLVVLATIQPSPGKKLQPVDAIHPALDAHGITKVLVLSVGVLKAGSTKGVFETSIRLREFRPPGKSSTHTPASAISLAGATVFDSKLPSDDLAIVDPSLDIGIP